MSEQEKRTYMHTIWSAVCRCIDNEQYTYADAHMRNYESKVRLDWPDVRTEL